MFRYRRRAMRPSLLIAPAVTAGIVAAAVLKRDVRPPAQARRRPCHRRLLQCPLSVRARHLPRRTAPRRPQARPVQCRRPGSSSAPLNPGRARYPTLSGCASVQRVRSGRFSVGTTSGALASDGHDPVNNPAHYDTEAIYRIAAVSPPPGTPIGRHELVTVQLAEVDSTAPTRVSAVRLDDRERSRQHPRRAGQHRTRGR